MPPPAAWPPREHPEGLIRAGFQEEASVLQNTPEEETDCSSDLSLSPQHV